ncbi:hypothetical protein Tdes44962_MAKER06969 [Teratosphaeria destructans]|uniref:Uncharacterized protein n=1 Tax=Teratosphaeria destructans TaxID=418781 RepID=A0A9W7W6F3_9PEZI|nr:hypothetical protein Tdes44962_MAKER06969 [Teratosphaeria destructans]
MDPIIQAAKTRHRTPKAPTPQAKAQLERNPFVQALATPVRQCALTHALLPSHFLLPFISALPDPSTAPDTPKATLTPDIGAPTPPRYLCSPARSYLTARKPLIDGLSSKKGWQRLVSTRMRLWIARKMDRSVGSLVVGKTWVWDARTADVVAERLKESVREGLGRAGVAGMWMDAGEVAMERAEQAAFVLYHGGDAAAESGGEGVDDAGALKRHLRARIPQHIVICDLAQLFSHHDPLLTDLLRRSGPDEDKAAIGPAICIIPKAAKGVMELQMALMRLQSYLRDANTGENILSALSTPDAGSVPARSPNAMRS